MNEWLTKSAIALAKEIREGKVSSEEVVRTYIEQAKRVNPILNAIVRDRYELALREAKEADEQIRAGLEEVPPLFGVPCSMKELFGVAGMPQTAGLLARRHSIAKKDATIVERLKKAGAILVGVTNVPVLAMHFETKNKLYGQTLNPHNVRYTPGGSSGGEGAIVSSAGAAFGVGSDIGGSIRMPAAFCGIFGHKPSSSLVPLTGHFPLEKDIRANRYLSVGPLTRFAEDLMPILKVIAGPDGSDQSVEEMKLGNADKVKMSDLIFYYVNHQGLHADVKSGQDAALQKLRENGFQVKEIPLGKFEHAFDIFLSSLTELIPDREFREMLSENKDINMIVEFGKEIFGRSEFPFYVLLEMILSKFTKPLSRTGKFFEMGERFREEMDELLGKNGVLIYPTHPYPAVKHGEGARRLQRVQFTGIFNVLHCAATAIPVGLSREGLPVSIQAISRKGNDHLTIAVAKYLESKGFGWILPKLLTKTGVMV